MIKFNFVIRLTFWNFLGKNRSLLLVDYLVFSLESDASRFFKMVDPKLVDGLFSCLRQKAPLHGLDDEEIEAMLENIDRLMPDFAEFLGSRGYSRKVPIIDCDAWPKPYSGHGEHEWPVVEHRKRGLVPWDPAKIGLFCHEGQKEFPDPSIKGTELAEFFKDKPVMNVNMRDWFMEPENQHRIPEDWKRVTVLFWGTNLRFHSDLVVPSLMYRRQSQFGSEGWTTNCHRLTDRFHSNCLAAMHIEATAP